jgi:hypothetical protein
MHTLCIVFVIPLFFAFLICSVELPTPVGLFEPLLFLGFLSDLALWCVLTPVIRSITSRVFPPRMVLSYIHSL